MRRLISLAALLVLTGSFALAQGLETELTIRMGEMFFQAEGQAQNEEIVIEAGRPYVVTFVNVGTVVHRVKFGRGLVVEEGVPFAYTEDLFAGVPVKISGSGTTAEFRIVTNELIELDLEAGESLEVRFTLPANKSGSWELGCFVIGHYEAGMRAPLLVRF